MSFIQNDGYVLYDEASDEDDDEFDSSDDDDESLWSMFDQINQANRSTASNVRQQRTQDAKDFEAEMNRELDNTLRTMHSSHQSSATSSQVIARPAIDAPGTSSSASVAATKEVKFYDDAYFDSDSDSDGSQSNETTGKRSKNKKKHPVLSNDDLLYDPDADDADQRWVDRRRNRLVVQPPPPGSSKNNSAANGVVSTGGHHLLNSDAVLNCPACMTTLCRDCQRHDIYKGQYRAMFVSNCKVDSMHTLKYPTAASVRKEKRKKSVRIVEQTQDSLLHTASQDSNQISLDNQDNSSLTSYNPVHCCVCNTQVAVYDKDEVYHFFNVLAGFN